MKKVAGLFFLINSLLVNSQTTPTDGNWDLRYVKMKNTPEAELMIRHGDIDNLGFEWPLNFSPFNGNITPPHTFPWHRDTLDALGFDMIMVTSGYNPHPAYNHSHHDSYSAQRHNLHAKYGKTIFELKLKQDPDPSMKINQIMLQMFVDDFQSPMTSASYKVYINKQRAQFMETTINTLKQNGHTGRLITFNIPKTFFDEFTKNEISLCIDDSTSGNGDGYAIDFIKILYNPTNAIPNGKVTLKLKDLFTHAVLPNAAITVLGTGKTNVSDAKGNIMLDSIPTGDAFLQLSATGYAVANVGMEIYKDSTRHEVILVSKHEPKRTHVQYLMSHSHQGMNGHTGDGQINLHTHRQPITKPQSPNGNLQLLKIGGKK